MLNVISHTARPALCLCLSLLCCMAQAASFDFAQQQLLLQQERERVQREQLESHPVVRLEVPAPGGSLRLPESETPCFRIDEIQLVGERAEDFQWALRAANPSHDPVLARCLGARGINLSIKRILDAVVARGFITTRDLAESRDLNSGRLVLTSSMASSTPYGARQAAVHWPTPGVPCRRSPAICSTCATSPLDKPAQFSTADFTGGFNLNWSI